MRTAIVETETRALLVVDPPTQDGRTILPEGVTCEAVTLSDEDAALIGQSNARYSVDAEGRLVVTVVAEVAEVPPAPTLGEQVSALQAAVLDLALGGL